MGRLDEFDVPGFCEASQRWDPNGIDVGISAVADKDSLDCFEVSLSSSIRRYEYKDFGAKDAKILKSGKLLVPEVVRTGANSGMINAVT